MQPTMTKEDFWKSYWFTPFQMVTVINLKAEDYPFMVEGRHFVIRSGTKEKIPGTVANIYLSQMTRILAQDDDKMSFLSDFALMKQYFDKLIVDVENLVQDYDNTPTYLKQVPDHMKVSGEPETPPWQAPVSAPVAEPEKVEEVSPEPKKANVVKGEVKEFELNGSKFKMIINKNGDSMYYKDGHLTSEAEYAKNASLL